MDRQRLSEAARAATEIDDARNAILGHMETQIEQLVFTDQEIDAIVQTGDIALFFMENMKKLSTYTDHPLIHTILQIVFMESYTHKKAYELARHNLYYSRRGYTEKVLSKMMEQGHIAACDVELITAEYYYGLKGLLDEYLLLEVWDESTADVIDKIKRHMGYFIAQLKKGDTI